MPEISRVGIGEGVRRRKRMQEGRNSTDLFRSRSAHDAAAPAALAIELRSIAQRPLTARAPRVPQLDVMCAAGAGGLFLSVAGASVPDAFSEGHPGSSPWRIARKCRAESASGVPGDVDRGGARLAGSPTHRERTSLPTSEPQ